MVADLYVLSASKPAHGSGPDLALSCRACGGGSGAFLLAADASGKGFQFARYGPGHPGGTDIPTRPGTRPSASSSNKVNPKAVSRPAPTVLAAAPSAVHLPPLPHLTVTEAAPSPNLSSPASATPDSNSGSDSWGSGSIQIALTTYSPSPAPDLSVLPHGVQGDVVVDVTIDPNGKVADLAVLHTLGYGIESSVIGTLKTWIFRPQPRTVRPSPACRSCTFTLARSSSFPGIRLVNTRTKSSGTRATVFICHSSTLPLSLSRG